MSLIGLVNIQSRCYNVVIPEGLDGRAHLNLSDTVEVDHNLRVASKSLSDWFLKIRLCEKYFFHAQGILRKHKDAILKNSQLFSHFFLSNYWNSTECSTEKLCVLGNGKLVIYTNKKVIIHVYMNHGVDEKLVHKIC